MFVNKKLPFNLISTQVLTSRESLSAKQQYFIL